MPRASPYPYTVHVPPPNSSPSGDGTPPSSQAQRRLDSRWTVLAAAMIAECAGCGIGYAFGIYSPLLKSQFGLTQTQLNTTNVASMIIAVPPFCFAYAWVYDNFGPRVSQRCGALCLFVGFGIPHRALALRLRLRLAPTLTWLLALAWQGLPAPW